MAVSVKVKGFKSGWNGSVRKADGWRDFGTAGVVYCRNCAKASVLLRRQAAKTRRLNDKKVIDEEKNEAMCDIV